jgi:spore germination protein (amino acid permease)
MRQWPGEYQKVSPYFVFYLIHTMQIGVGILGFERYVVDSAGHDAWIAVITSGMTILILVWISYRILNKGNSDLVGIHVQVFGKWLGGLFSIYFILYYSMLVLVILRTYVEVIQVWIFPYVYHWVLIAIILVIAYTYVTGGFRVVTGIAFLGVIYGLPLLLIKYFPLQDSEITNLLPLFTASTKELVSATKEMTLNFLGFELLFMFYPFIKSAPKSEKWAHFAVLFSMLIYLITLLVTLVYFSQEQLMTTIWPSLTLWKIVDLAIIERFEYIGIAIWFFVVLPNICLGLWCASRGIKRLFPVTQRNGLRVILILIFIGAFYFQDRQQIDALNNFVSTIGFYTIYLYIPFLYLFQMLMMKLKKGGLQ